MISVGTRDARKGVELGFGGRREMEDTELEEGEACSSHINEYDPNIDALSYIDDRIQDVLGHFQKEFEGEVSAENLGAKWGGYGSFLPSYQRSPVWSHPKTPQKVHNYSLLKSPNNLKLESGQRNNAVCYSTPQSVGIGTASTGSTSLVVPKAPSLVQPDQYAPRHESANKKAINSSDQKTLKVRIKVGSDNLSTRKNAIYSGLGLDTTPSSSLDDSPSESEGISHEPRDAPFESPTSILQIMTSFPVHEDMMSPLHDDLIYLIAKEKLLKEGTANGTHTMEGGGKVSRARKTKSVERNDLSVESKSGRNKDGTGLLSKKEHDIDMFVCEEFVSKTLKLPLLSNSFSTVNDVIKSNEIDKKSLVRDKVFPAEDEPMERMSNQEDGWVEKRKANLAGKVQEDRKVNLSDDVLAHPKKEGCCRGEKTYELVKGDLNVSKGRKALNTEIMNHSKQKVNQKAGLHELDDTRLYSGKEYPLPGEKKKPKESQRTPVAEMPKESSRVCSSSVPKMKSTHANSSNTDQSRDTYRDLFGDIDENNQINLFELPFEEKLKDTDAVAKSTPAVNSTSRERQNGNKFDKPSSIADSHPMTASNILPRSGNGPMSAGPPATGAPALIEDSWVCCDKCQKWRLLPYGTNPESLPEKWLCSMLNWLPGMNRCNVNEEETTEKTKALIAQYQVSAPESQSNLPRNPGLMEGVALPKPLNPDQNLENFGLPGMPSSAKKKNGAKELPNATNKDGSIQFPNSMKKTMQASVKSRSLNDVNQSPLPSEPDLQQLSKSSDMAVEKRKHKYREKHRDLEPSTGGGDIKNLKIKSRRDSVPDSSRASKKIKTEVKHINDEGWTSDYNWAVGEVGPSSSGAAVGKDQIKNRSHAASITKTKDEAFLKSRSLDVGNCDSKGRSKKRKVKESSDMGSLPATGCYVEDHSVTVKEEFSENDRRKEKKARTSKSDGKESSASKGSGRTDKKSSHTKNQQHRKDIGSSLTHRSRNGMDSLKKDLGFVQVPMAATSSSSKISGSQKTKSSFQEVKGSPVESVSSSPMRILNPDKLTSVRRDLIGKDESQNADHFAIGSPRRCSDGEDDGGSDRSATARKDKVSTVAYHGSHESSVLDFQDRDSNHISGGKVRGQVAPSPDITNGLSMNGALGNSGQDTGCPKQLASNQFGGEYRENGKHYHSNGSHPRKSGKGYSSSWLKDKNGSFESDLDIGEAKNSKVVSEQKDHSPSHGIKPGDGKNKCGSKSGQTENKYVSKKDVTGKSSIESSKREGQSNFGGHDGPDVKPEIICKKDAISTPKQNSLQDCDGERLSKIPSGKTERVDAGSVRGKSLPLPTSGGAQNETTTRCPRPAVGSQKGNGADSSQVDASEGNDALKQIQTRKVDNQNGTQHISSRHLLQNGHRARDTDAPSPVRRDSGSQAVTSALKEAKDLKHLADRVKNAGSTSESTGFYFQAAVKFLHAASLLENIDSAKHNDMTQCMQMYSSTAKLCKFCAHEYEKPKDMAAAALAYKCMEVAYMRAVYCSHASASRDRLELQTALQLVPPGESPSSSASDVDNLNNPSTVVDKVALPKGVSSPQVAGSHVIAARNRPNFLRILNFTQDVNFAMEASRKSQLAFAAANTNTGDAKRSEGISAIKRALDFHFQDVEGLLHLVRLAMDAISR
ncbi:cysteine-tryptophan domain-containing zinc finger protein 3-like [Pyrus communis]|uniref:cysteine-tryptophan domain-containing zinc finger protein 3-like n=1 Tax=Pyrus communis TaxID=23211 RepID=UPI0035C0C54B